MKLALRFLCLLPLLSCPEFAGTLTFTSTWRPPDGDQLPVCDLTAQLTGSTYDGECPDCDFAFEVSGEVTRDEGTPDCVLTALDTLTPDEEFVRLFFGCARTFTEEGEYGEYTSEGSFPMLGWEDEHGTVHASPMEGAEFAGDEHAFIVEQTGAQSCSPELVHDGPWGGVEVGEDIPVDDTWPRDTWRFEDRLGGTIRITADTTADDSACNLDLSVVDAEGCFSETVRGGFAYSHAPESGECPAVSFVRDAPATYLVEVAGYCAWGFERGEYVLRVEVPDGAPDLVLLVDDGEGLDTERAEFAQGRTVIQGRSW